MWKWIIGVAVVVFLFALIVKPEWFGTLGAVFSDFIRANET